jgi:hypothetical protein
LCECRRGCVSGEQIDAYISAYRWTSQDLKPVLESPCHANSNERIGCMSGENIDAYTSTYIWPSQDPKPVLESPYHAN